MKPPFFGATGGLPVLVAPQHGPATADTLRGDPGTAGGGLWPRNALGGGAAKPPGGDGGTGDFPTKLIKVETLKQHETT